MAALQESTANITRAATYLVFSEATSDQRIAAWSLNGASWASPLSLEDYVGREQTLSETPLSRNGGSKYWVLHLRDDPNVVVAGLETTFKKILVADAAGCRVEDAYSIASVFTDPRYRGHGLASRMLREVQKVVDQTTECGALYSDIGRVFYTKLGWRDYRSPQVMLTLGKGFESPSVPTDKVSLLTEADVASLCEKDVEAVTRRFQNLAQQNDDKTYVTFLPSFVQCEWHFARDTYVARVMLQRQVHYRGAATADQASWIYWDHDVRESKLKIMRIVTRESDPEEKRAADVKLLLAAALKEASDWRLPTVLIWCPDRGVCDVAVDLWRDGRGKLGAAFDERESGSIPSLRWKGGREDLDIVWENNEYFAWC